jgi:hypothetical protein
MPARITPIRPRKPNRRPGALPAHAESRPSPGDLARGAELRVMLEEARALRDAGAALAFAETSACALLESPTPAQDWLGRLAR